MDNAGHASTDSKSFDFTGCDRKSIMSKLSLLAYPLIAAVSLAAASVAFAEDITPDNTAASVSTKSRAQVQSELFAARADGSIKVMSISYNHMLAVKSVRTRDEVRAERERGFDNAWYGEDSGSFALARQQRSRVAAPLFAAVTK